MTVIYDDATLQKIIDWSVKHKSDYINSGGVKGHIMDMSFIGGHRYEPMLLLRYVGRKTGQTRVTPLGYALYKGQAIIAGSNAGSEKPPAWYLNIKAGGPVAFQVATQAFNAEWRELEGAECEEAWSYVEGANPIFKQYRANTTRKIPLIALKPLEDVPVFKEA